jgi:hypothetical protein
MWLTEWMVHVGVVKGTLCRLLFIFLYCMQYASNPLNQEGLFSFELHITKHRGREKEFSVGARIKRARKSF